MKKNIVVTAFLGLIALVGLSLVSSCQEELQLGQERVVESSQKHAPKWTKNPPEKTRKAYYFVGEDISSNKTDRYAYQVALSKAGSFVSTQATSIYKRSEESLNAYDANVLREEYIKNMSNSAIKGAHIEEIYWEKVEKLTENGLQYTYHMSVLISVSVDSIKASQTETLQMQIDAAQKEKKKKKAQLLDSIRKDLIEKQKETPGNE